MKSINEKISVSLWLFVSKHDITFSRLPKDIYAIRLYKEDSQDDAANR